jgi:alkylation response protein AidB-like acyl-CoA dehydrogenase
MDFAFSEDQELLRGAVREFVADQYPIDKVVGIADSETGSDPAAWKQLADLGWLDPDLGLLEHAVIAEESAYALLPAPWFSTIGLAWPLLDDELRGAISSGERSATLAWAEAGGPATIAAAASESTVTADGESLTGTKVTVPDLDSVTDVVVVAADGLYLVDVAANPRAVVPRSTIDRTRRLSELQLSGTPARKLAAGLDALTDVRRRALALLACEATGVSQRALDLAGAYTKERQQFGRVIGTYQGVSHRVANTFVATQLNRSLAYWAAWAVSAGDSEADLAVAAAKAQSGDGSVFACEQAIQSHGGIGFTWEHPLHRFYKRAQWISGFEGNGRNHRSDIAETLLGPAA